MATKSTYIKSAVFITVTSDEIEKLLIEKYASIGLTAVPEVEFNYSSDGVLLSATIDYETHSPKVECEV